ncbi:MAG: hypothetical protein NT166_04405 [Candidatus Aminicenantes bacterium]|nr:hypothetical protein [Candidatus Aminicenantes bacterium]
MKEKRITIFFLVVMAAIFLCSAVYAGAEGEDTGKNFAGKFKLQVREDKQKGITTYMPKGVSIRSRIVLYIVKNNQTNIQTLRLRLAYFADEMLFIKQYVITADDKEYILPMREMTRQQDMQKLDIPDVYSDHEGAGICEYYDVALLPQEIEILRLISTSKSAKMKYVGTKGNQKVNIHKEEIKDIKRVFEAFDAFKTATFK